MAWFLQYLLLLYLKWAITLLRLPTHLHIINFSTGICCSCRSDISADPLPTMDVPVPSEIHCDSTYDITAGIENISLVGRVFTLS